MKSECAHSNFLLSLTISFLFLLAGGLAPAHAQNARIHHQIVTQRDAPPTMGRDFWFSMLSNYWGVDNGGKYMRIYITSTQNTTAFVMLGVAGAKVPIPIEAYKIGTFHIPEEWEMESSGFVEQKAIHVWSNDADLTVYDMSHNEYTSDGSYIIPTIGWGTDYVVAGYASLYEQDWDDPSEFSITANTDNTTVEITPSCDFRQCISGNESGGGCANVIAYPAGVPFIIQLNRGDDIEFKPVQAQGPNGYDVTGTIVHSNYPVGVNAGCDCADIPAGFDYCDHVEHMIPTLRTWGETYYTTNFKAPPQQAATHDFGLYLMVSSKAGQTIWRQDAASGKRVECLLTNQYETYWDELELAQKFWSDAPFMLVEYMNSASYPDEQNGIGDPAEVVINPSEQFSKTVFFQTPVSQGNQLPYTTFASIVVNKKDESKTTFDGQLILALTKESVDDTFDVFTKSNIAPGAHVVSGDSLGVGVSIYGSGYDESFAWAGALGLATFHGKDIVAPVADTSGECYAAMVHVADSGVNAGGIPQSKLSMIRLDSDYNMAYMLNPDWKEGSGADTSGYAMFVLDRTKPAYLQVDAFDFDGNRTTITSTYIPQAAEIEPSTRNFGTSSNGTTIYGYDTIINTGQVQYDFTQLELLYGNVGFSIDSGMTPQWLAVGERRVLKIAFQAVKTTFVVDSLIFGDACGIQSAALIGSGGGADFLVTGQSWPNELLPPPSGGYVKIVTIENFSTIPITIDTAWWADDVHFVAVDAFHFTVPAANPQTGNPGTAYFHIAYFPDSNSGRMEDSTVGNWISPNVLESNGGESIRTDILTGSAVPVAPSAVSPPPNSGEIPASDVIGISPDPANGSSVMFQFATGSAANLTLTVYDVLGREVGRPIDNKYHEAGEWKSSFDISKLPSGTYTYRLQIGQTAISKQFVIQH